MYGGRTVFAAWISDVNGNNLKTLDCRASSYLSYLSYWKNSFRGTTLDATTGATYLSVPAFSFTWDFKARDGVTVPDGKYYFNVEYCQSGSSRYSQYLFTKSSLPQTFTFANSSYFNNVSVKISIPSAVTFTTVNLPFNCYIIPGEKKLMIDYDPDEHKQVKVSLFDAKGLLIKTTGLYVGDGNLEFNLSTLLNGVYIVRISDEKRYAESHKIILR